MQNMHFPKLTTTNCIYILAFYWHLNNNSLLDNGWARQNFQNWFCCCGSKVYPVPMLPNQWVCRRETS